MRQLSMVLLPSLSTLERMTNIRTALTLTTSPPTYLNSPLGV